jgi:hypothetical protein
MRPHSEKKPVPGRMPLSVKKVTRRRVAMKCTTWLQKAVRRAGSATRRSSMAVALGNFLVAPAPRSQLGDQMADQFQGVGIRVGEALQRLGQRIAGGGRLAEQPAEKCTHSCHGVVFSSRRRSRRGAW